MIYTLLAYIAMEFIEAPAFTRLLSEYFREDDYAELQMQLERNPDAGEVMVGTGGFRKLRWRDRTRGQGRRGGLRIIYYNFPSDHQIWLVTVYGKNEAVDLTSQEKKALRTAIEAELQMRAAKRTPAGKSGRQR